MLNLELHEKTFLFGEFRKRKKTVVSILSFGLLAGVIEFLGISLIFPMIYLMVKPEAIHSFKVINAMFSYLGIETEQKMNIALLVGILFMILFKNVYMLGFNWFMLEKISAWKSELSKRVASMYLFSSFTFHMKKSPSDILKNVALTPVVFDQFILQFFNIFISCSIITGLFSVLFYVLSVKMLLITLVVAASTYLTNHLMKPSFNRQGEREQHFYKYRMKILQKSLGAILETKIFGKEPSYIKQYAELIKSDYRNRQWYNFLSLIPLYMVETTILCCVVGLVIYYIALGKQAEGVAVISVLVALMFRAMPQINKLLTSFRLINVSRPALNEIAAELYNNEANMFIVDDDLPEYKLEKEILIDKICYRYPTEEGEKDTPYVLQDISFKVERGEILGITGTSGAGKSTLVLAMLGLLELNDGHIYVDGIDLLSDRNFIASWQKSIGYVPQSVSLYEGDIFTNVAFSDDYDEDRVTDILEKVGLTDLVQNFGNKDITEQANNLSGGQRQRIGIARSIYKNPNLLVLDEPTSGLDAISANRILSLVSTLSSEMTIIIITHQVISLKICDQILLLEAGKIDSRGSYDDVLESSHKFRKLVASQEGKSNLNEKASISLAL